MPKINHYIVENKKSIEIVQELKGNEYQVPTFEEFIKTYQIDEKVNYSDLEHRDIGDSKKYGPCEHYNCSYSSRFYLKIGFAGGDLTLIQRKERGGITNCEFLHWITMSNVQEARDVLRKFESDETGSYTVVETTRMLITPTIIFGMTPITLKESQKSEEKRRTIMLSLKRYIESHERGSEVYEPTLDYRNR